MLIIIIIKNLVIKFKFKHKQVDIPLLSTISWKSRFEGNNRIGKRTTFAGKIGYASYIGDNSFVKANIGRFCSIANNVHFITGFHPLNDNISTSPVFYSTKGQLPFHFANKDYYQEKNEKTYIVEDNVWIGHGAIILNGSKIGEGAVIGAGAIVTKDVPPYAVVAGTPAKIIRYRFSNQIIQEIVELQMFRKEIDIYVKNFELFLNINKLDAIKKVMTSE